MGPIAVKTLGFYMATTAIAISLALFFAVLISPGAGVAIEGAADFQAKAAPPLTDVLVDIFPSNPIKAMADGKMLQIIVFALLFGYAISHAGEPGRRLASFFRDVDSVIIENGGSTDEVGALWCIRAAFQVVLQHGDRRNFRPGGLFLYRPGCTAVACPGCLQLYAADSGWPFSRYIAEKKCALSGPLHLVLPPPVPLCPLLCALWKKRMGVHNSVAGFTVPLGATINMDGTAIMQGVATVFIAQVYGVDLSTGDFLTVILTATLASIGTAAVPGVGLITLALVLEQAGLPVEGIALIIGVDRLLDMVRTAVNVTGDATVSLIVAKSEKQSTSTCLMIRRQTNIAMRILAWFLPPDNQGHSPAAGCGILYRPIAKVELRDVDSVCHCSGDALPAELLHH